jgi:hypothetical protein
LIILHATTKDGPLFKKDEFGNPVDNLKWKGDTCYPTPHEDGKCTCKTLWVAQSFSADYHNNMKSEMLMQWVQEKLVPTFEREYPEKNDSHCQLCRLPSQAHDWLSGKSLKEKVD